MWWYNTNWLTQRSFSDWCHRACHEVGPGHLQAPLIVAPVTGKHVEQNLFAQVSMSADIQKKGVKER
jgi:hypothetical protein